tara:strand:- start:9 stop:431 length:423 start_codon:yes stop_codon:yes gene_type:complete
MNEVNMVIDKEYVNELDERYFFTGYRNALEGNFRNLTGEYVFPYSDMTEAKPRYTYVSKHPLPEFKFNDEIGVNHLVAELEAAYVSLENADKQLINLRIERQANKKLLKVLVVAGFLDDEKICQARDIIKSLDKIKAGES